MQNLDVEPIYLERAIVDSDGGEAVALTVDLASRPDGATWDESLWKRNDGQLRSFQFVPIAQVKYATAIEGVPQGARHFRSKI
jgi:hypothetical protein